MEEETGSVLLHHGLEKHDGSIRVIVCFFCNRTIYYCGGLSWRIWGRKGVGWRLGNSLSFVLPNLCKYTKCYCPYLWITSISRSLISVEELLMIQPDALSAL